MEIRVCETDAVLFLCFLPFLLLLAIRRRGLIQSWHVSLKRRRLLLSSCNIFINDKSKKSPQQSLFSKWVSWHAQLFYFLLLLFHRVEDGWVFTAVRVTWMWQVACKYAQNVTNSPPTFRAMRKRAQISGGAEVDPALLLLCALWLWTGEC